METAQELREALKRSREEAEGITLNLIARIMKEVFDEAELRVLTSELTLTK